MEERKFPKTRQEAQRQGVTYYFTGEPCKRGHICERFTSSRACKECVYERNRQRTTKEDYWLDYGDEAYKERKREASRRYYQRNKAKWDKMFVKRRRQERLAKRSSTEADKQAMKRMKLEAQIRTIDRGVKHEVDHIIPLIHPLVCGLSTKSNLQVLTKAANRRKASRFNQNKESKVQLQLIKKPPEGGKGR
jgi:hypothetical protein